MVVCKGITVKGIQCKRVVKNGGYCCSHVSQHVRNLHLNEIYKDSEGWPSMAHIQNLLKVTNTNVHDYDHQIMSKDIKFYLDFYGKRSDVFNRRLCLLLSMETILICRNIVLPHDDYQKLVTLMVTKCKEDKSDVLVNYTEYFRRKVDRDYRMKEGRVKYIHYIISISELGIDIADVVCRFL